MSRRSRFRCGSDVLQRAFVHSLLFGLVLGALTGVMRSGKTFNLSTVANSAPYKSDIAKAVLFVPCFVDGFWSNMRQIVLYAYTAYQLSLKQPRQLSWVAPVLYFHKYNSSGDVVGTCGPVQFATLFDITTLSDYVNTVSGFDKNVPYIAANLTGTPFRCSNEAHFYRFKGFWGFNVVNATLYSESWFEFNEELADWISKSETPQVVVYGSRALPHSEDSSYWARITKPFGEFSTVHYELMTHGVQRSPYSNFVGSAFKFQLPIRLVAQRIIDGWKLEGNTWAAVHVRTGSGYPGDHENIVTVREIAAALRAAESSEWRCARAIKTVVLSSTSDADKERIRQELQLLMPRLTVVYFTEELFKNSSHVQGWNEDSAHHTIMRDLVEVQVWITAPVFIGCRSTMDEFAFLLRNNDMQRDCTLSSQPCFHTSNYTMTHTPQCGDIPRW